MSRNNYTASAGSSGDEDNILTIETPPAPKKNPRRKRRLISSDDEESRSASPELPSVIRAGPAQTTTSKKQYTPLKTAARAKAPTVGVDETSWQKAMDIAVQICTPLKVDIKDLTLLPDAGTLICFRKAAQSWMSENKIYAPLTYSTQNSLVTMIGRFIFGFVIKTANLSCEWNPSGCAIWNHKSTQGQSLKCLHGTAMITREHVVEMDISSENAQKALKETPDKAKVTTNKWNRSIVQLKSSDAKACANDSMVPSGTFSSKSCGMFFTDGNKVVHGLEQIMALQAACYPKMNNASTHLLMPVTCDCNWGDSLMLLGRQVCKMTPFALNAVSNMDVSRINDPKLLATINHPVVLVFQCCNPVWRASRTNPQKNCDFKISAPDVMAALQLAKQMWMSIMKSQAPVTIPEFKWSQKLQYQSTLLPTPQSDNDDALF